MILLFILISIVCMMKRKHDKMNSRSVAWQSAKAVGTYADAGSKRNKLIFFDNGGAVSKFEMDELWVNALFHHCTQSKLSVGLPSEKSFHSTNCTI